MKFKPELSPSAEKKETAEEYSNFFNIISLSIKELSDCFTPEDEEMAEKYCEDGDCMEELYILLFYSKDNKFIEYLLKNELNINDPTNYERKAKLIELIGGIITRGIRLYYSIGDKSFLKKTENYEEMLKNIIKGNKEANFLLFERVKEILKDIKIEKDPNIKYPDNQITIRSGNYAAASEPFGITQKKIAFWDEGELKIGKFDLGSEVQSSLYEYAKLRQDLIELGKEYRECEEYNKGQIILKEIANLTDNYYGSLKGTTFQESSVYLASHRENEESSQDLRDFLFIQHKYMRDEIEKNFNFKLNLLNIPEQFQFLSFLKTLRVREVRSAKKFIERFEYPGLRTFLSMEQGGKEMGNKILKLGKKLPEDVAQKIFAKYEAIIDSANRAEEEIRDLYKKENIPNDVFIATKENLLKSGAELLSTLADNIKEDKKIDEQEILKTLENIKTQILILGTSYVELYKEGVKIPIGDINNTSLEKISAQDLKEEEKAEILEVYEKGRPKETYDNKEHIKLLREEFKETLNNKDTYVFNIRFKGEIIAFATFNKENEDTLHVGGLTFIEDIRNPAIAVAVMNAVMKEFGDYNIKALVHSKNKILQMYTKRFGFKITKELPLEENAGELYFEIERPKNKKEPELEKAA